MGTCDQANEGAPEISASAGDVFLFAGHHGNTTYNWATADNVNWGAGGLMPVPSGYTYAFDPGATTHGGTGLNYLSIMADDAALVRRIVIAGATPSNMDNGLFAFSSVIGTSSQTDGPVMYFDPNTWNLWVSDRWLNGGRFRLHLFSPCVSGAPGSPTCPLKAGFPITVQSGIAGHPNVIVNPCTQNAVAGYFAEQIGGLNRIRIRFYNTSGTRVGQDLILASAGLYQNGTCVGGGSCTISGGHICKCGGASTTSCGGSGCHTLWHRVHMSVRYVGSNDCRLAVGFENALTAGDGQRYYKGWYYILNIANENLVTILGGGESSPSSFARNEWGATVSLNQFTAGFGFFYYQHQNSLPCTTVFRGVTNTNYGVGSTTPIGPFTDPFPTMRFANVSGLGHYIEIVRRGLPNGHLFPTWAEPVVTSAVCPATCLGSARSDRVMGVRVTP